MNGDKEAAIKKIKDIKSIEQKLTNHILFKLDKEGESLYYINHKMNIMEEMVPKIEEIESWLNVTQSNQAIGWANTIKIKSNAIEILHGPLFTRVFMK